MLTKGPELVLKVSDRAPWTELAVSAWRCEVVERLGAWCDLRLYTNICSQTSFLRLLAVLMSLGIGMCMARGI